ncbi:MAG TPA: D-lyxose/D-mannose family sugar isomerase, partial [Rectinemataceae bacterium]|nr:D-lyxose/D-mannose family sugar isomerase [Rectinemataceae bacterium]
EKVMVVEEGQETPMHFHWSKMEDIIVRGGGSLAVELYRSTPEGGLSDEPVLLRVDGVLRELPPGGRVVLGPGESVCLESGVYHRFWGEGARVLVGEVSMVNDDLSDNRFLEDCGRFPEIEEDEEALHLLVCDYPRKA